MPVILLNDTSKISNRCHCIDCGIVPVRRFFATFSVDSLLFIGTSDNEPVRSLPTKCNAFRDGSENKQAGIDPCLCLQCEPAVLSPSIEKYFSLLHLQIVIGIVPLMQLFANINVVSCGKLKRAAGRDPVSCIPARLI